MKLKKSVRKKLLTGFLIGMTLAGSGIGKSFADSNSSDLKAAPKQLSDSIINEMSRARSRVVSYSWGNTICDSVVWYNGKLYLVNNHDHHLSTGIFVVPQTGEILYFSPKDGTAQRGWYNVSGCSKTQYNGRHYFADDYTSDKSGFYKINGYDYLFNEYGIMKTGIQTYNGDRYFLNSSGAKCTGWTSDRNGNTRLFDPKNDGKMTIGFYYDDPAGTMFFCPASGVMAPTGIMEIDESGADAKHPAGLYNFVRHGNGKNTYLADGFATVNGNRYYFDPSQNGRALENEWFSAEKRSYNKDAMMYFDKYGHMAKGVTEINGETYVFTKNSSRDDNYYRNYGWYTDKSTNKRYYFTDGVSARSATEFRSSTPKGAAVTGKQIIDGKTYNFDSNGVLIR